MMLKLLTIIGARPQIIKAAAISRAIRTHHADGIREVIVHTGQHYDERMSAIFLSNYKFPSPIIIYRSAPASMASKPRG